MGLGRITLALLAAPLLIGADSVDPLFKPCHGGMRVTCVVDGDTLWLAGDKIRLADINTPEVTRPGCPAERALGDTLVSEGLAEPLTGRRRDWCGVQS